MRTYEYLPKQGEFLQNIERVRHAAYIGGFGSGKTHVLTLAILAQVQNPKTYGLVGASTYRLLADTTQRKFFELCPPAWIKDFKKSENRITLINGAEVIFRSLEAPEKLTNLELDWFALDEIGEVSLDTFRMLQGRLRRPGGTHRGFCVGNPAGPAHWTYNYFVQKKAGDQYVLSQAPSYENTFLSPEYAKSMEESYGKGSLYYKRFVLGEFVAFEGAYWTAFSSAPYPEGHVMTMKQTVEKYHAKAWRHGRVIDWGYTNPFVCMWYFTDGKEIIFYDEYYQPGGLIRHHCQVIRAKEAEHQNIFGPHTVPYALCDHDAQCRAEISSCINDQGDRIGFEVVIDKKDVMDRIIRVASMLTQKKILFSDRCQQALVEVPSYRAKKTKDTQPDPKKEGPYKKFDHTCDCIGMAASYEIESFMPEVIRGASYQVQDIEDLKIEKGFWD